MGGGAGAVAGFMKNEAFYAEALYISLALFGCDSCIIFN
jgi:hypothetical protein